MNRIGDILLRLNKIDAQQLKQGLNHQKKTGLKLGHCLIKLHYITEDDLIIALEKQNKFKIFDASKEQIDSSAINFLKYDYCVKNYCLPYKKKGKKLYVALSSPDNKVLVDDIQFLSGLAIEVKLGIETQILKILNLLYEDNNKIKTKLKKETNKVPELFEKYFQSAILAGASDLHFEAFETKYRVRHRINGVLETIDEPNKNLYDELVSVIKIKAELDITEKRLPQDGSLKFQFGDRIIDIRISIIPGKWGENVVVRFLDNQNKIMNLSDLGLSHSDVTIIEKYLKRNSGLILLSGPTGSGKTTTLYSMLNYLNTSEKKIITIEDPIEYNFDGIVQVPVNHSIGVTFSTILRSLLRHDPDIIMIGEIRDKETAEMAMRAALTGHLVLSTLHTTNALSVFDRLIDMGIPEYLVYATLSLSIAQRLVRVWNKKLKRYTKRIGIFEILEFNNDLIGVLKTHSKERISAFLKSIQFQNLYSKGLKLVKEGITKKEEILRVAVH